jgi:hypothetical protein
MKRAAAFLFVLAWCCCVPAIAVAASAPSIEYRAPSSIRNIEATLHFAIDPEGLETEYEIEVARIGQSLQGWQMPGVVPAGEEPVAVEAEIPRYWEAGLMPGTEYHWRLRAWNSAGETIGPEQFFATTDGPAPLFKNLTALQTGSEAVTFTGSVDPEGVPLTGCRFRWVTSGVFHLAGFEKWAATQIDRFGKTVPCKESLVEISFGTEPVTVHADASGLEPGEYFFRLEGENAYEDEIAFGGAPFTVSATPPVIAPPIPPGEEPPGSSDGPGASDAPGLGKAPGLQEAPALRKAHKKARHRRLRHNATISAKR